MCGISLCLTDQKLDSQLDDIQRPFCLFLVLACHTPIHRADVCLICVCALSLSGKQKLFKATMGPFFLTRLAIIHSRSATPPPLPHGSG